MNSFEQNENFIQQIAQVIDILTVIKNQDSPISEIDKAVVLENLRKAYVSILKCPITSPAENIDAERERIAREEQQRKEQEERERIAREEQQRKEREERERIAREEQQRKEQEERERIAREEQQRKEQEERERIAREEQQRREQEEREKIAREEQQRKEQKERERIAREEQQRKEQEERERIAREERQRKEQEERERIAREEQQRKEQAERERIAREEQQRKEQAERERIAREEQQRKESEAKEVSESPELFDIFTPISEAEKKTPAQQSGTLFANAKEKQPVKTEKRSLNDLLQEQNPEKPSLYSKIQESRIEDLAKAISLNDKFLFIKELFKNQGEDFSKAIKQLNKCSNLEEAFAELEKMKKYYLWDTVSPAYLTFCDLVRRRFL